MQALRKQQIEIAEDTLQPVATVANDNALIAARSSAPSRLRDVMAMFAAALGFAILMLLYVATLVP